MQHDQSCFRHIVFAANMYNTALGSRAADIAWDDPGMINEFVCADASRPSRLASLLAWVTRLRMLLK